MARMLALALLVAACGGKHPAPASTANGTGSGSGSGSAAERAEKMATMPAEVGKFHDVLAPRWHAAAGPKRMTDTCSAIADFKADADGIAKATPPTTANADTWTAATRALVASVDALSAVCTANETDKFEAAFSNVHDSFHALMKAAGDLEQPAGSDQHKM